MWKELVTISFDLLSRNLSEITEENYYKLQSGHPNSRPIFEPGTVRIQRRSVDYATTALGI